MIAAALIYCLGAFGGWCACKALHAYRAWRRMEKASRQSANVSPNSDHSKN